MFKRTFKYLFFLFFLLGIVYTSLCQALVPAGKYKLEELLRLIGSEYNLTYSINKLPSNADIVLQRACSPDSALAEISAQAFVQVTMEGTHYILKYEKPKTIKYTISGRVTDAKTGEALIGATVLIQDSHSGVVTNEYGFYTLTLTKGKHALLCSYIGYQKDSISTELIKNITHNFRLALQPSKLAEVTVSSKPPSYNISSIVPGVNTLNLQTEGQIPYFLGEVDVLQGVLLMPGIRTIGEDASGINVRGGGVDQNLLLLDEAVVYNPNHFYGLISVFNPEAVNNIEIMKGFMPPSHGGRASSVITVNQKEGNNEKFQLTGGIGLVSARLIAEGPISKGKSSFIVSARQSIADLSVIGNSSSGLNRNAANFQDLNTKINWTINPRNKLYLSGYFGNDRNRTGLNATRNWGNKNLSIRWNHLFGPRLFSNTTFLISEYSYKITDPQEAGSFIGKSNIIDYTGKWDLSFSPHPAHEFTFGINTIFHRLKPGERIPFDENSSTNPIILDREHALEAASYFGHQITIGRRLIALYGFRHSTLLNIGPADVHVYEEDQPKSIETIIDTLAFDKGELIKEYNGFEPRLSVNYLLNETQAVKASYSRTYQYLHLISNTVIPSPTDIWKISDTYVPPTRSDHYSLGYYHNFNEHQWESSMEVYYKYLNNIIEYKNGADLLFNPNIETELLTGIGRSYGLEFFLKKNKGPLTGWISYTLSRSELKVSQSLSEDAINFGNYFPANHDKLHDVSVAGIYALSQRWSGSLSFNYSSGRPITLPTGKYEFEGTLVPHFQERNQSNLPDYHRLDISFKLHGREEKKNGQPKKFTDYWTFVIYNVYGRKNAYSLIFRKSESNPNITEAVPFTIFDTPIPAITYNFKF